MGIVTQMRANAPQLDPANLAIARLFGHRGQPRAEALADCIDYLQANQEMTERRAESAAVQALAELESINSRDVIDIAATTSNVVVFSGAGGQRIALTVRDLRELLKGRDLQAGSDSGRLLLLERH